MKRKLIILSFLITSIIGTAKAQQDSTRNIGPADIYAGIYHLANKFNDPAIARMALYQILMYSPEKGKVLDSLALYYYNYQQWSSATLVSQESLILNPNNELALELGAISLENMGLKDKSLEYYETLFLKNDNSTTLYKIAFLQYDLQRFKEASTSAEILIKRPDVEKIELIFPKEDKTEQTVSMKAALMNLKGLIAKGEGNITRAKELFLEALKLAPGFEIAQVNLRDADK